MDKKAIILIIINIIMSITLGLLAYFTYGFRGINAIDVINETTSQENAFYIGDVSLSSEVDLPNKEDLEIRFGDNTSIKISINSHANISFKKNNIICGIDDVDIVKSLHVIISDHKVKLNTARKTLTNILEDIYPNDEISEVIETKEQWIFCLILSNGKITLQKNIYNVGVDIGPDEVRLNMDGIIL